MISSFLESIPVSQLKLIITVEQVEIISRLALAFLIEMNVLKSSFVYLRASALICKVVDGVSGEWNKKDNFATVCRAIESLKNWITSLRNGRNLANVTLSGKEGRNFCWPISYANVVF